MSAATPKPKLVPVPAKSEQHQTASFRTALLGFMLTTTLTTSLMVLLSQG